MKPSRATASRLVFTTVAVTIAATALAGCASDAGTDPDESAVPDLVALLPDDVREAGQVVVAVNPDNPPIKFVDDDGKVTGFAVEQFRAASEVLGLEAVFETATFDAMIPGLGSGDFDALVSIGDLPDRHALATFIDYAKAGTSYLGTPDMDIDASDPANLCGLTIGFARGSLQQSTTEDNSAACVEAGAEPINGVPYQDANAAVLAMASGEDDIAFIDSAQAAYLAGQDPDAYAVVGSDYFGRYGVVFSVDDEELVDAYREALLHLVETGAYDELATEWAMTDDIIPTFPINLADE